MLNQFASSLTACIIVITMIEMILPNGKNKKYVTLVSSMLLIIIMLRPIVALFHHDFDLENILQTEQNAIASEEYAKKMEYAKEKSMQETYEKFLKEDIITRLEENGYRVKDILLVIDENSYEPTQMELQIEHIDGDVEKVVIDVSSHSSSSASDAEVKEILHATYGTAKEKIEINH